MQLSSIQTSIQIQQA
jgi:hypothetical protein